MCPVFVPLHNRQEGRLSCIHSLQASYPAPPTFRASSTVVPSHSAGPALLSAAAVEGQDKLPCYNDPRPALLLHVTRIKAKGRHLSLVLAVT